MDIKKKFLELTSKTYPHGTESEVFKFLCDGLITDEFGNLFLKIGDSDVMFTSHLDTATSDITNVNHKIEGNIIKTDGTSILGADDKAGVTIMLNMIENNVPGLYYFFLGEEVGCIGSKKVANKWKDQKVKGINKVISFDRRGNNSVITYQSGRRCASDEFGHALSKLLNDADPSFSYRNDPTGILTDSIQFIGIYSECTNISVGYNYEHTFSEQQDIEHLEKLAVACTKIDWNSLPTIRDFTATEYKTYTYEYGTWGDEDYTRHKPFTTKPTEPLKNRTDIIWFQDKEFGYVSSVEYIIGTGEYADVDLCDSRIAKEKITIENLLNSLDIPFDKIDWDGLNLYVNYDANVYGDNHITKATRSHLIIYLPELDFKSIYEDNDDYILL